MPTDDRIHMSRALRLARRGLGLTAPNPMVGAVLVREGRVIGCGWHRRAGEPHAEIEALRDAEAMGHSVRDATLYVTLEPCCTHGRTPPCTAAIIQAGIRRVVVAAVDPNPVHAGRAFGLLKEAGIEVQVGILAPAAERLNEAFNHWIVQGTPFVTAKAAMTLDGKIATETGDSKWITGPQARAFALRLRLRAEATLVGIGTVLADDPALTVRAVPGFRPPRWFPPKLRIVLDSKARTPLTARLVVDSEAPNTRIVVGESAPIDRVAALKKQVTVLIAPEIDRRINLRWLLAELGAAGVVHLLVEGGGTVLGSFFEIGRVERTAFFYAPLILGGKNDTKAVAGAGFRSLSAAPVLNCIESRWLGGDLFVSGRVGKPNPSPRAS